MPRWSGRCWQEIAPGLRYSAALLGPGSEVLGFDTERSTDHDWGPRLQVFLPAGTASRDKNQISRALAGRLPAGFDGYPSGSRSPASHPAPPATTSPWPVLGGWVRGLLGFDPQRGISLLDWLATPAQRLAEFTSGAVFHDGLGELGPLRDRLAWYPDDLWRYLLACQWRRIAQEEAFAGRCAEVGDGLGSAVIVARLARDLMRLCLLMDRRYPPYSKWLGTAFARSLAGPAVGPPLTAALAAPRWRAREQPSRPGAGGGRGAAQPARPDRAHPGHHAEVLPPAVPGAGRRPVRRGAAGQHRQPADPAAAAGRRVDQFIDSTDALADAAALRTATAALLRLGPGEPVPGPDGPGT